MSAATLELLSPELVLVDPLLAERAKSLPEGGDDRHAPPGQAAAEPRASTVEPPAPLGPEARDALRRITEVAAAVESAPSGWDARRAVLALVSSIAVLALGTTLGLMAVGWAAGDGERASADEPVRESIEVGVSSAASVSRAQPVSPAARPGTRPAADRAGTPPLAHREREAAPQRAAPSEAPSEAVPVASTRPGGSQATASWPRTFTWQPVRGATAYRVALIRDGARVFVTDTARAHVTIPATWDLGGAIHRLDPRDQLSVWTLEDGRLSGTVVDRRQVVDLP